MKKSVLCLALIMCMVGGAFCQTQQVSIAYVNFEKVRKEYRYLRKVLNSLSERFDAEQAQLNTRVQDFKRRQQTLMEGADMLEPKDFEDQKQKLLQEYESLLKIKEAKDRELESETDLAIKPITDHVRQVVEKMAREQGVVMVFKEEFLAYGDPRFDLTDRLLTVLNAEPEPAAAAAPAAAPASAPKPKSK